MRLYIAEKPSMGREIAAVLPGPVRKGNGFIETGAGTVTWLFGHVLRQAEPQEYDAKYKVWRGRGFAYYSRALEADGIRKQCQAICCGETAD